MSALNYTTLSGRKDNQRIPSRILEEMIQTEVNNGARAIEVEAYGQHGIGGRLWRAGNETIHIRITGQSGQRTGSLGFPNTRIDVMGPTSDDIGWLNAGAEIVVHGNASNGALNGGAQGKVFIAGNIGARGMTMTKRNPRFAPPELWVLGSVGDYFGEFMAGGIAVICGHTPQNPANILGHRPFVGMVGGKAFFRGPITGYSTSDARIIPIEDEDWAWLTENLTGFLEKIGRPDLFDTLSKRSEWQLLRAKTPQEKMEKSPRLSMAAFRQDVWDRELGRGGLIGDLQEVERGAIPVIAKGEWRRFVPVWENNQYKAPCQTACPTGIPSQERWHLIRQGLVDEAVTLGLDYTPFPATVCGYLCPSPCMASCTRNTQTLAPIDVRLIGRAGGELPVPGKAEKTGKKVAVIGAGPGGISAAWQLSLKGHDVTLFDAASEIGGKISAMIPDSRIPQETLKAELKRAASLIQDIRLEHPVDEREFKKIRNSYDYVVVAAGASRPRMLPIMGIENAVPYTDFLAEAKKNTASPGKTVVIIGAGNVGCDVATEAYRLGAETVTMIDVQKPAAFGKEREEAEAAGATFRWPCFTREITDHGVILDSGELLEADTVIVSIGDVPDIDFLGTAVAARNGFVTVDAYYRTSEPTVFAIGDMVAPGLLTHAIGAGRRVAETIDRLLAGKEPAPGDQRPEIDAGRVSLEYYDTRIRSFDSLDQCGGECASCGRCRDCGICVTVCPEGAISRSTTSNGAVAYNADPALCIGCGFCSGACPCGIWSLIPNTPM